MDLKLKRTLALVGHAHCGKTTLCESLLFKTGATSRKGDVMQGTSVSDYNDDERERKISINASLLRCEHQKHQIQMIDTPGYADFIGEVKSALRVVDAAVMVVDAVNGVEVQTEAIWEDLDKQGIPRIIFINKTDKDEAHVNEAIASIQEDLSKSAHVMNLESSELIESVAETDDVLLEKYLESGSLSPEEVSGALRKAILNAKFFPILTGSALNDEGISELLEALVSYLPSPADRPPVLARDEKGENEIRVTPGDEGAVVAFAFKALFDPHIGQLSFIKIIRGKLAANSDLFNVTKGSKEHVGNMSVFQGKEQSSVSEASCGDIVALPKLKNTRVSDTLTDPKEKCLIEPIEFPEPSISASIKPKTRADEEKISSALQFLCEEDHTFRSQRNAETKELIVSGIGDLHLKILLERMEARYKVGVEMGTPKVSYREAITKPAQARYKYKKQSGGRGQYGDVDLKIEPLPLDGENYEFVNAIFGGAIPKNYIPSVEKGVIKTIEDGVLAGYHLDHIKVTVVDGSYHDVDSSDMAFQLAGGMAMKEAVKQAGPVLLEPVMEVTVVVPDDFIGQISGDVSSRRGRILGSEAKGKKQVIKANVPLSEMYSYATDLRSMTAGRGSYSMKMSHYEIAPPKITDQVIAESRQTVEAAV